MLRAPSHSTSPEPSTRPPSRKESFTYHLSAGTYYVMPNTVACNWTLTIYEKR